MEYCRKKTTLRPIYLDFSGKKRLQEMRHISPQMLTNKFLMFFCRQSHFIKDDSAEMFWVCLLPEELRYYFLTFMVKKMINLHSC